MRLGTSGRGGRLTCAPSLDDFLSRGGAWLQVDGIELAKVTNNLLGTYVEWASVCRAAMASMRAAA